MIVVNGHVYPQLDSARLGASAGYRQRKLLYHNRGDGTFDEVAAQCGAGAHGGARQPRPGGRRSRQRRAARRGDQRSRRPRRRCCTTSWRRAGQLADRRSCRGKGTNTDAIGAVVTARSGGNRSRTRSCRAGRSYISQEDMRRHFGLGAATQVDASTSAGRTARPRRAQNVKAGQILRVKQDAGR